MLDSFSLDFSDIGYRFPMIFVKGTDAETFEFGSGTDVQKISIRDFFISQLPVTQILWERVMGEDPAHYKDSNRPVECVSYDDIAGADGFLDRLNTLRSPREFRLPTESEWEYAARGGLHWRDNFTFSGGNDLHRLGWFHENSGAYSDPEILARLKNNEKGTQTQPVGQKAPNQLGIHDMCGNVWEWCEDYFQREADLIPTDGSPCLIESVARVLRGGCHHNGSIHCTVSKRYEIQPNYKDPCIGFRLALSAGDSA